jgi:hypothetical protein
MSGSGFKGYAIASVGAFKGGGSASYIPGNFETCGLPLKIPRFQKLNT